MKRFCSFLLILLIVNCQCDINLKSYAMSETNTYAKALKDCVLYKSSEMTYNVDNIYFIIPESYFVVVLDNVSDNCFKVQYDKYVGYVDSSYLVIATFIPIVKTLESVTCDIKQTSGTQIWNKPSSDGAVLTTISAGTKNISYIAKVYGEIPSGGESNLWYYISYTPKFSSTNVYEGYIYSENVANISEIVFNAEINPEILDDEFLNDDVIYISSSMKTVLVVFIAVPIILLILIILYKLMKNLRKNTKLNNFEEKYNRENISYENDYVKENNENTLLKSKLHQMQKFPLFRKTNYKKHYPPFPNYDSEDDLL